VLTRKLNSCGTVWMQTENNSRPATSSNLLSTSEGLRFCALFVRSLCNGFAEPLRPSLAQWPTHGVVTQLGAPALADVPHAIKALPHVKPQEPIGLSNFRVGPCVANLPRKGMALSHSLTTR
jgi:hypothetical protein